MTREESGEMLHFKLGMFMAALSASAVVIIFSGFFADLALNLLGISDPSFKQHIHGMWVVMGIGAVAMSALWVWFCIWYYDRPKD